MLMIRSCCCACGEVLDDTNAPTTGLDKCPACGSAKVVTDRVRIRLVKRGEDRSPLRVEIDKFVESLRPSDPRGRKR